MWWTNKRQTPRPVLTGRGVSRHTPSPAGIYCGRGKGVPVILIQADVYTTETHTARLGKNTIIVESHIPKLSPEQYRERCDDIRYALYDIFQKYEGST